MMEKAAAALWAPAIPQVLPALLVKVQLTASKLTDLDWTLFTGQKRQL